MSKPAGPETARLAPTKIFWIVHHTGLTKSIRVLDITGRTLAHYNPAVGLDDEIKGRAKETANSLLSKEKTDAEAYRIEKQNWQATRYLLFSSSASASAGLAQSHMEVMPERDESDLNSPCSNDVSGLSGHIEQMQLEDPKEDQEQWKTGAIAHWKAPWRSTGKTTLSFPQGSKHSSHTLTLKPVKWYRRTETFVQDSVLYSWEPQHKFHSRRYVLIKQRGEVKKEVARFAMVWNWSCGTGGVFAVDGGEDGVDEVVAVLGALVLLKKTRQRDSESSGGGG